MTDFDTLARKDDTDHEVKWSASLDFNGQKYDVAWVEYSPVGRKDHPYGHWLIVWKDGEKMGYSNEADLVQKTVSTFRAGEVGLEYSQVNKYNRRHLADYVLDVFNRAQNGEFIGQTSGLAYLYDIARIFDVSENTIYQIVMMLRKDRKIGLSGSILIPYEQDELTRNGWFEHTGHRDYDQADTDAGWWRCLACGTTGDIYAGPKPEEVPCVD